MAEYTIDKIEYGGNVYKLQDNISGYITGTIPTKTSDLTNDSGFITASHTSTYSLPTAVYNTLGGVKPAYSTTGTATLTTSSQAYTNSPTIAARTTTIGKYYGIEIDSDGRLFVNVPWTDTNTKVTVNELTSNTTYYPILATGTGTATRQIDSTLNGLTYNPTAGTTSIVGSAILTLGNNIAEGTANNEEGTITLYSNTQYYAALHASGLTQNRALLLPDKDGTLATTDLANASNRGLMSNTDKIYLDNLSGAIGTTSSTITIKNGSSGGRTFYLETSSSDTDDTSLISAITSLGWDSDVIVS